MKILFISDLHGKTVWRDAPLSRFDEIVFLGDYVDSPTVDNDTIYENLYAIIQLKQRKPDTIRLLLGNHDVQYLYYPDYSCSGFNAAAQPQLTRLFRRHDSLFNIAHQRGSYLFTHAGVTTSWFSRLAAQTSHLDSLLPRQGIAQRLNLVHMQPQRRSILFDVGPARGGCAPGGGPVWADQQETSSDYLPGFHQVVAHTPVSSFTTLGDESGSITYTDVLRTQTEFYELTIPA